MSTLPPSKLTSEKKRLAVGVSMRELGALDVSFLSKEINEECSGSIVDKVYEAPLGAFRVKTYGKGRKDLIILGNAVYLTKYKYPSTETPSNRSMFIRKRLKGEKILEVRQIGFDRIISIDFGEYALVVELFGKGNLILLRNGKIEWALHPKRWRHRSLVRGEEYSPPPEPKINLLEMRISDEVLSLLRKEPASKVLAINGLGSLYAKEICLRAGLDPLSELKSSEEVDLLIEAMKGLSKSIEEPDPRLILEGNEVIDVTPIPLVCYKEKEQIRVEKFNYGVDEMFSREYFRKVSKSGLEEELIKLEKILQEQISKYKELSLEEEKARRKGDLISSNINRLNAILEEMKELGEKERVVEIHGEKVLLRANGVFNSASSYYERAKRIRKKLRGLNRAIEETKSKISKIKEEIRGEAESIEEGLMERLITVKRRRKREWYERYRWFFTSRDHLVIGGRDRKTNEEIVEKRMDRDDLYFHAQIQGAPHVVLKTGGDEISKEEIEEAGIFAASFSRAWREKLHSMEVFWVRPEQVSKKAPSGEYLPRGSFLVRGKRNYLKVGLKLGICFYKDKVMCAPLRAMRGFYLEIEPGDSSKDEISRIVAREFKERMGIDLEIDEIMRSLPPGGSRICGLGESTSRSNHMINK